MYTCDGDNVSPPLAWGSIPTGTVELALTDVDPDANNFVHWVMAGIDPSVQAIDAGAVPDGVVQGKNSTGSVGWTGPCPPKGPPHHYVFTLYALTAPSGLTDGVDGNDAMSTIMQHKGPDRDPRRHLPARRLAAAVGRGQRTPNPRSPLGSSSVTSHGRHHRARRARRAPMSTKRSTAAASPSATSSTRAVVPVRGRTGDAESGGFPVGAGPEPHALHVTFDHDPAPHDFGHGMRT